jgi:hypothetical protein
MEISGVTADILYREIMWNLRASGKIEQTRNGEAMAFQEPVIAKLIFPSQRIVFNAARDANPFFHIAEVVWMLSGACTVNFIEQFNKKYRDYADENTDIIWGAYGRRWIEHWGFDQIQMVIDLLLKDAGSRRVLINMWDPESDLTNWAHNDLPCNTQCLFRVLNGSLDMTVINRSNDLIWGMMGANVVHFTYLLEVIALGANLKVGNYRVMSNNLHMYTGMPRYKEIFEGALHGVAEEGVLPTIPILANDEAWEELASSCYQYVAEDIVINPPFWMKHVAIPMMEAYKAGKGSEHRTKMVSHIMDIGWRRAAQRWLARR